MADKKKREPKNKREFPVNADDIPCHLCGGTDFEWGQISHAYYVRSFWSLHGKELRARVCQSCGNVQTFIHEK